MFVSVNCAWANYRREKPKAASDRQLAPWSHYQVGNTKSIDNVILLSWKLMKSMPKIDIVKATRSYEVDELW